ncbi:MAG: tetratricopeptide repeat protein [Bacteroidia bacterium]|nr:tetratricopeptide repeat protein [Bacteroidia bacterium]
MEKALEKDSTQPFLYELKGFYYYTKGDDQQALFHYKRALELGGSTPQLHHRLGAVYLMQRNWKEAHRHLLQALQADSSNPEIWTTLGLWAHSQGHLMQAAAFWKEALRRDSTHDKARTLLYDLYLNDFNQPESAKKWFLDPYWTKDRFHPLLNLQLGNYYLRKLEQALQERKPKKLIATYGFQAIQAYSQALLAHPSYAQAYYNRGYVYFRLGKQDKALDDFSRAAELNPQDARAFFMKGSLLEAKGDTFQALQAYKKALYLKGDFPEAEQAIKEISSQKD